MRYCPYCGRQIRPMTNPGITSCGNCGRVFDTSAFHRILSFAWFCRRENVSDPEILRACGLSPEEIEPIIHYVVEGGYSHDDFYKLLRAG